MMRSSLRTIGLGQGLGFLLFAAMLWLVFFTAPAFGVVVLVKGEDQPKLGFLVERTPTRLVMRVQQPDGTLLRETIPADQVDAVIESVSTERLEALSPDKPAAYREYAEELVDKRRDPEAAETAKRLYTIAAHLDPQGQGRGSLLGMTRLLDDPRQIRQLRALAYLLDPRHDPALLQSSALPVERKQEDPEEAQLRQELLAVLVHLRRGRKDEARVALQSSEIQTAWPQRVPQISLEEAHELANGTCPGCQSGPAPDHLRYKLVAAELSLLPEPPPVQARRAPTEAKGWSRLADTGHHRVLPPLNLADLTGFDPTQTIYRDGRWKAPGEY